MVAFALSSDAIEFLYENDRRTLLAAVGVRNALRETRQSLPDYSVAVMPLAKAFEGFATRLTVHLCLIAEDGLKQQLNQIATASWLAAIWWSQACC